MHLNRTTAGIHKEMRYWIVPERDAPAREFCKIHSNRKDQYYTVILHWAILYHGLER